MDTSASTTNPEAEGIRATERERIRALVHADIEVARQLHADDFQLITPLGATLSKEQYLGAVAAGDIKYLACELDSPIDVRLYSEVALIRYRSQIEIMVLGQKYPRGRYWHTDAYEKRDGRWQVVWSHATGIT
jgi:hypothetical protein